MRNAILRQLQAEYEQLRLRNAQEEERRRQEVIAACPEIARLLAHRPGCCLHVDATQAVGKIPWSLCGADTVSIAPHTGGSA